MIPVAPMIVPVQTKVNCIIQDGKQFCEENDITNKELGGAFLSVFLVIIWAIISSRISDYLEEKFYINSFFAFIFIAIGLPLLVIGLILVI